MLIDRSKIKPSELSELGSNCHIDAAYEEADLDAGVCAQVEETLRSRCKLKEKLQRNLQNIREDIRFAEDDIKKLELSLDAMLCSVTEEGNRATERNIRSLENEIETKMRLLDTLRRREAACKDILSKSDASLHIGNATATSSSFKHNSKRLATGKAAQISKNADRPSMCADDADLDTFQRRICANRDQHSEDIPEEVLEGGLRVPGAIWSRLYTYQREGVSWLWGLHQHGVGGILGDEMGLGKTVQIISFLAALDHSKLPIAGSSYDVAVSRMKSLSPNRVFNGLAPVLIVCPGTVLKQWLAEFRTWMPAARVIIVHSSGSGYNNLLRLISSLFATSGIALTTYGTLIQHSDLLVPLAWHYVILDEGHKIKNPQAEITNLVKRFVTPHRLIVSGTPMQNNLKELWCIFDFVYPGRLGGGMMDFLVNFAVPITQGGYANATPLEVETAYRCACTLKRVLSPYLLRRLKTEVRLELPKKSEQVLFCRLTHYQRCVYEEYLSSRVCQNILRGNGQVLGGLVVLKKLCNHPDLVTGGPRHFGMRQGESDDDDHEEGDEWRRFGCSRRSGKLMVTLDLLALWWEQKHKVLLFTQSRKMLNILERHASRRGYTYLRMDGGTPTGQRQRLVEEFNSTLTSGDPQSCFLFLLTTRVGGLGVNLTGADRVLIFDPDWNPSTDAQARERAWRIGQEREVMIYRLLTSGTIEEKVYQRQIFKQFLANRVLRNPRQQRFFKINNLYELFSLGDARPSDANGGQQPESMSFFKAIGVPKYAVTENRFDRLFASHPVKLQDIVSRSDEEDVKPEVVEVGGDVREVKETPAQREARLRAQARRLSRRLVERYTRRGTHVDGRRIRGVERQSRFDEGEARGGDERHKNEKMDPFVTSVICGANVEEKSDILKRKREEVDEEMKVEAKRVAKAALKAITKTEKRKNKVVSSIKKRLQGLTCVNHDKLMNNYLMSEKSVDPALQRLQASRLASGVVAWLKSLSEQIDDIQWTAPRTMPGVTFGLVKNRFLWSPKEAGSPLYLAYKLQGKSGPLRPGDLSNNLTYAGYNRLSSRLLLELIRERRHQSMSVMGLANNVLTLQEEVPPGLENQEKELRKLALKLLALFTEENVAIPSASTGTIAERFKEILATRKLTSTVRDGGLTGRHFRAVLRALANPPLHRNSDRDNGVELWTLKPQFVTLARQLTLGLIGNGLRSVDNTV
ncbi:DNA excision repair protein ERCC-6 [Taenia crassiceps]|uniref:DNA excision repair protein ERCC-6 n=1 Tax=Taenia crassiceps TaxID=6207 RepID=A0ABR4QFK8_9CEST